ncbi:MAG: CusA/CzcA family heavy metal efflux RND transporter [Chitinophagaceae bacterium]|nr:CusA/CzcA family heavy metal efflux RND transporter [Chitinophagaceae bacterium]
MLSNIIHFSVHNKLIIAFGTLFLIVLGIHEITKFPIDAVPDITNNQVQVITVAPSFGATDIERLVTFPIEQATTNIAGLKEIRSFSRFGLSLVTIVFHDDIDIYWARQQIAERLQKIQSQIPREIGTPEIGPLSTGLSEIYQYIVRTKPGYEKKYTITDLRSIQDWIIKRYLNGTPGVAEISSFGGKLKQYSVSINTHKLYAHNLTIYEVLSAMEKNNQNTGGAYIEKDKTALFIKTEGLLKNKEDIEKIIIKFSQDNNPIFIKDVADVEIGYATRYGALCYNDQGEVAGGIVLMLKGANSNDVIKQVKKRIGEIEKNLPEGIVIEPFLDRTKLIYNAINTVLKNLAEAACIVVLILIFFLGDLKASLIVASIIPLSMLFAIILMNAFGVSGNLMSLGALDFGLIIDGAVIIVESVMHQLAKNNIYSFPHQYSQPQMDDTVKHSTTKMMNSAVFGQIIILVVYLPIFTLQGIEGKMFKPMAETIAFALLGAFILSLTYIPMVTALFLNKKSQKNTHFSIKIMHTIENIYQKCLTKAIRFQKTSLALTITLFITSLIILNQLGSEFVPVLEEGDFAVDTRVLKGSNLTTTIESTQKAAKLLKNTFPEIEKIVTKIGSAEIPTDPMPLEASDMMVILKDKDKWTSANTFDELAEKMSQTLQQIPGVTFGFQYPVQMRFNELISGAKQDVVCKIFGENIDTLNLYAEKISTVINTIHGTRDVFIEPITGVPQIVIEYNRNSIAQYNMSIADVNTIINIAFAGQIVGSIYEDEKRYDLVLRLHTEQRKEIEDIQNILIPMPNGTQIPLRQIANVTFKNSVNQIQREDAKRRTTVAFNTQERDIQSIVDELKQKINADIKLPTGYYIVYGGTFENLLHAKKRLYIAIPIALSLIFILLFFAFRSLKMASLIYSAIPLSVIGGIFFLWIRNMPFSICAGVGFIALFGVAVLNGIVLISEYNYLKDKHTNVLKRVIIGSKNRIRPILITASIASIGFLPMALSTSAGSEVQRPLATVVIGGLIISTMLTLFILPILYTLFEKKNKK